MNILKKVLLVSTAIFIGVSQDMYTIERETARETARKAAREKSKPKKATPKKAPAKSAAKKRTKKESPTKKKAGEQVTPKKRNTKAAPKTKKEASKPKVTPRTPKMAPKKAAPKPTPRVTPKPQESLKIKDILGLGTAAAASSQTHSYSSIATRISDSGERTNAQLKELLHDTPRGQAPDPKALANIAANYHNLANFVEALSTTSPDSVNKLMLDTANLKPLAHRK